MKIEFSSGIFYIIYVIIKAMTMTQKSIDIRRAQLTAANITSKTSAASAIQPFIVGMAEYHVKCMNNPHALAALKNEILEAIKSTVGHGTSQAKYRSYVAAFAKARSIQALEMLVTNIWSKADGNGLAA